MDELTEAFRRLVEASDATAAQWLRWHLGYLGELAADPITRVELGHALRSSPELLHSAQMDLDSVGDLIAEASLAHIARIQESARQHFPDDRERDAGYLDGAVDHRDVPV